MLNTYVYQPGQKTIKAMPCFKLKKYTMLSFTWSRDLQSYVLKLLVLLVVLL